MPVIDQVVTEDYAVYHSDCMEFLPTLPAESVGLSVYSPPFPELYQYSDDPRDMTNCTSYDEAIEQYRYVVREVERLTKPGRLSCVHCTDLKRGQLYQHDFPGDIIRAHEDAGMRFFCRVTIWRDAWEFARRTRMNTLMHKTLVEDSTRSRIAPGDYLMIFKKPGENREPVTHQHGFKSYAGERPIPTELREYVSFRGDNRKNALSQWIYRQYASPVWMDIRRGRLLPYEDAREDPEEKHVCLAHNSRVLTRERGYVPIQDVRVGERVLTHKGRWRRVMAVQNTGTRPSITIRAQGVPGLTLTRDHKLWTRQTDWARERDGAERAEPGWQAAGESLGSYINFKLPDPESPSVAGRRYWWIIGRWLADGFWDARGYPHISCGAHKMEATTRELGDLAGNVQFTGTAYQIRVLDESGTIRETLSRCGQGASGKHLPPEAFILPAEQAKALLDGYLSGDGHFLASRNRWLASSVSRDLLLGLSAIVQRAYGAIASVYAGRPERISQIDGRTVRCRQDWVLCFDVNEGRRKQPFIMEDGAWKKVRAIEDAGDVETWNLRVEEDESFTAEGCIVKNCPLQLDTIERCILMWSNPGDVVLSPFMGVGSEVYMAVVLGRKGMGAELKGTYYRQAVRNVQAAIKAREEAERPLFVFDLHGEEADEPEPIVS